MGLIECWMHFSGGGFYTAVGESWKHDREAMSWWSSKNCVALKADKAVHAELGKRAAAAG